MEWRPRTTAAIITAGAAVSLAMGALIGGMQAPPAPLEKATVERFAPAGESPSRDVLVAARLAETAAQFAPSARSVNELDQTGVLREYPQALKGMAGRWHLTPTAVVGEDMPVDRCTAYTLGAEDSVDRGVAGFQCLRRDNRFDLVFRNSAIAADDRGFWVWRVEREEADGRRRLQVQGDTEISQQCPGTIVVADTLSLERAGAYCIPAFRGEPATHEHWGAYYYGERPETLRLRVGGREREVTINPEVLAGE